MKIRTTRYSHSVPRISLRYRTWFVLCCIFLVLFSFNPQFSFGAETDVSPHQTSRVTAGSAKEPADAAKEPAKPARKRRSSRNSRAQKRKARRQRRLAGGRPGGLSSKGNETVPLPPEAYKLTLEEIKKQKNSVLKHRLILMALATPLSVKLTSSTAAKVARDCLSKNSFVYDNVPGTTGNQVVRFIPVSKLGRRKSSVTIQADCGDNIMLQAELSSTQKGPGSLFSKVFTMVPKKPKSIALPRDNNLVPGEDKDTASSLVHKLFGPQRTKPETPVLLLASPTTKDNTLMPQQTTATVMLAVPCGLKPTGRNFMCGPVTPPVKLTA